MLIQAPSAEHKVQANSDGKKNNKKKKTDF